MSETQTEQSGGATETATSDDFTSLLVGKFKPRTNDAENQIKRAVQTLAEHALATAPTISGDTIATIKKMVAQIDEKLTAQVNQILHAPEYQKLEGAWRGLHYLVNNTETDNQLKIKVMPISKKEVHKTLKKFAGTAWDQSPLFKKVYEEEYGSPGGEPYGCLVGDYHFDHSPQDVELLGWMSNIAAAAHAPFISGAAPSGLQFDSWEEMNDPRDIAGIFTTAEYAEWRALRESEDARYIGLALPRFLARRPYGAKFDQVEEFDFEEDVRGENDRYTWANAAYAMAVNINRSFKNSGWCTQIRGTENGGLVGNLPMHTFPSADGGVDSVCPTEFVITDRREAELSDAGFLPLQHTQNTNNAVFRGGQSLQKAKKYLGEPDATASAALSARLPYLFATCRFSHYLKCIVRDQIGSFTSREGMERSLTKWIMNYVDGNPERSTPAVKAKKPLAEAQVQVTEVEGDPGNYKAVFHLKPHYQLEKLSVSLRLVSKLPAAGG